MMNCSVLPQARVTRRSTSSNLITKSVRSGCRVVQRRPGRRQALIARADSDRSGGFTAGFLTGGIIFGTLGFLFAPQISRALLTEDQKLRLPRFLEDEVRDPEQTRQELSDKIAQLNAAMDEVSNQMKSRDPKPEAVATPDQILA